MRRILLATLCLAGCQAAAVQFEGRPCSASEPCGGSLVCDPLGKVCVRGITAADSGDATARDAPAAGDALGDHGPSGERPRDRALVLDRRLLLDRGGGEPSSCSPPCAPGQDCLGGKCTCVAGGACDGCCQGDLCLALASQQTSACGVKGKACVSCVDGNACTSDACQAGACQHVPLADGTACGGGATCKAGVCSGCTPACGGKQCGPDGCGGSCGSCTTPPNTTCNASGACVCTPACGGKQCGPDGCGGSCGSCGSGSYCSGSSCASCPTCASLGYYTGSLRACTFDGSNGCWCPGTDGNSNNVCDSGESCWGADNCSPGNHNPANCSTKKNISVPAGCTAPPYCIECS